MNEREKNRGSVYMHGSHNGSEKGGRAPRIYIYVYVCTKTKDIFVERDNTGVLFRMRKWCGEDRRRKPAWKFNWVLESASFSPLR